MVTPSSECNDGKLLADALKASREDLVKAGETTLSSTFGEPYKSELDIHTSGRKATFARENLLKYGHNASQGLISNVIDHLGALEKLVFPTTNTYAPYTLVRTALEALCTRMWLTDTTSNGFTFLGRLALYRDIDDTEVLSLSCILDPHSETCLRYAADRVNHRKNSKKAGVTGIFPKKITSENTGRHSHWNETRSNGKVVKKPSATQLIEQYAIYGGEGTYRVLCHVTHSNPSFLLSHIWQMKDNPGWAEMKPDGVLTAQLVLLVQDVVAGAVTNWYTIHGITVPAATSEYQSTRFQLSKLLGH